MIRRLKSSLDSHGQSHAFKSFARAATSSLVKTGSNFGYHYTPAPERGVIPRKIGFQQLLQFDCLITLLHLCKLG
jgi:hypothetical protein